MTAYSEKKDYEKGDFVYVLVPLGDYSQKKTILSKVVELEEIVTDARPFETYAPVTENFNASYGSPLDEYAFIVNKDYEKILFQKTFSNVQDLMGYDRLGIKLSIYAKLKTLTQKVIKGKYKIKIVVKGIEQKDKTIVDINNAMMYTNKDFEITMEDMICIDPYYTSGYCVQEKVFDITDFSVSSIKITVVQSQADSDAFLDEEDNPVSSDNFFIKFKDIYCTLGYHCEHTDIETEKLYVYPIDGLKYDFSTSASKKANARLISFHRDLKHMPYGKIINSEAFNGWAYYSSESSNRDENFGNIPGYIPILNSNLKQNDIFNLYLNTNKGLQENKFLCSIRRGEKPVVSNELIYTNNDYIKNAELLDNITGFSARFADNRENFNIYGLDNKLLNDQDENKIFYLIVSYNSVNGRKIMPGDTISWSFPEKDTMIVPYEDTNFVKDTVSIYSYYSVVSENDALYRDQNFWIPFKIKNIYNQNFINNTINCSFSFKDENDHIQKLELNKSLTFGFSGSEGSEYICNLELYKQVNGNKEKVQSISKNETNFNQYSLELNIYDYNMKAVNTSYVEFKWLKESQYSQIIQLSDFHKYDYMDRIIVARYQIGSDEYITSYLPIGTLLTDHEYSLEGCKTITYDSFGSKPYFYKGEYKLFRTGSVDSESNIAFVLNFPTFMTNLTTERPIIINKKMRPYDVYIDGLTNFSVQAKDIQTNTVLLEFPIVVIQNQFTALIENFKKDITLLGDQVDKVLLGSLSDQKDGMILGKLKNALGDPQKNGIGLYNYIKGKQFFTLDEKNGLLVEGDEDGSQINLSHGNLNYFNLNNCNGTISNATKLVNNNIGISIGSNTSPVYFSNGVPVVCTNVPTSAQITELTNQINQMKAEILALRQQIGN